MKNVKGSVCVCVCGWGGCGWYTKIIYMGNCLKRGLRQFAGGLAKNREKGAFEEGLIPRCTL